MGYKIILSNTFGESLFLGLFPTSSSGFDEFDIGNINLFQVKVFGRKI